MFLYVLPTWILLSVTSMRCAKLHISSMLKWRGDCSVLYDNLVDWNNRSEIKVCAQQFRTKLWLFYTARQLYCHSDTVTNRHECALESSSCKNCFQDLAQQWGLELQTAHLHFCSIFPPALLFNKFDFHQSETTVSNCQIGEEDFLLPIYPFF